MQLNRSQLEALQAIAATGALPTKNGNEPAHLARHRYITAFGQLFDGGLVCSGPNQTLALTTKGKEILTQSESVTRE